VQRLQLVEVLPSHPLSPGRQRNEATASKHRKQGGSIILQVKPFLPPPLRRSRHGDFKVRIYSVHCLNMDNRAPIDH
jgi:hypothetical protein